ncbi:hypothetical protein TNCV_1505811 [Trichonephila clavipes]|nr:hypothetical protein TNCV_1505811 [Trichonephila clavipes]
MQIQVIVTAIVRGCGRVVKTDSRWQRTNDCRTHSNKSGMLAMSTKATMIRAAKSSALATSVSYTSDFRCPLKKKSKGLRFGEREDRTTADTGHHMGEKNVRCDPTPGWEESY